jgi:hypothetical protein
MTEARFWVIYLTMVKRLLPAEAFADAPLLPRTSSTGGSAAVAAASSAASAVAAAATSALSSLGLSRSSSKASTPVKRAGSGTAPEAPFAAQQQPSSATAAAAVAAAATAAAASNSSALRRCDGSGTTEHTSEVMVEAPGASAEEEEDGDGLGDLENDAELEAYLQEALQVGGRRALQLAERLAPAGAVLVGAGAFSRMAVPLTRPGVTNLAACFAAAAAGQGR